MYFLNWAVGKFPPQSKVGWLESLDFMVKSKANGTSYVSITQPVEATFMVSVF